MSPCMPVCKQTRQNKPGPNKTHGVYCSHRTGQAQDLAAPTPNSTNPCQNSQNASGLGGAQEGRNWHPYVKRPLTVRAQGCMHQGNGYAGASSQQSRWRMLLFGHTSCCCGPARRSSSRLQSPTTGVLMICPSFALLSARCRARQCMATSPCHIVPKCSATHGSRNKYARRVDPQHKRKGGAQA